MKGKKKEKTERGKSNEIQNGEEGRNEGRKVKGKKGMKSDDKNR